jgi:hypothetical protein
LAQQVAGARRDFGIRTVRGCVQLIKGFRPDLAKLMRCRTAGRELRAAQLANELVDALL